MSKRKRPRPAAAQPRASYPAGRTTKTALKARRRWLSLGLGGVILVAVIAVIATAAGSHGGSTTPSGADPAGTPASAHTIAPDGSFTTTSGATRTVFSLHGQPTLLWFVTTWCSSCQAGTQAMSAQIPKFAALHVRVVELENADDLGQPGPPITEFAQQLAGHSHNNPDWTFGTAASALTQEYNPKGDLDIYYLLNSSGHVVYINSSPSSTMGLLLRNAAKVGSRT